jgi:uncharacterized protein (TIGR02284 family)
MNHDKAISVLNNLIETTKDGEKGFKTAAEGLTAPDIKHRFLQYSRERAQMTTELQAEVRRLGGDPERSGSMAGALHRGWLDIKSVVTEAERGEDVAKSTYESALNEPLPASAETLVQQQAVKVRQAHNDVRSLREREKVMK